MPRNARGIIMEKNNFNKIISELEDIIKKEAEIKEMIENCDNFTLGEIKNAINDSRVYQGKATNFLEADLYHIIGMGGLNCSQMAVLTKKVKALSAGKCYLQAMAILNIQTPKTNGEGKYTLHILSSISFKKER